jgi:hypothetical protein
VLHVLGALAISATLTLAADMSVGHDAQVGRLKFLPSGRLVRGDHKLTLLNARIWSRATKQALASIAGTADIDVARVETRRQDTRII